MEIVGRAYEDFGPSFAAAMPPGHACARKENEMCAREENEMCARARKRRDVCVRECWVCE